jgi:hypothetical protein
MKKIKKIVLSVLLLTFGFVLVHDFVVPEKQSNVVIVKQDKISIDLHEKIHNLLVETLIFFPHIKQFTPSREITPDNSSFFLSQVQSVLQRPPLS